MVDNFLDCGHVVALAKCSEVRLINCLEAVAAVDDVSMTGDDVDVITLISSASQEESSIFFLEKKKKKGELDCIQTRNRFYVSLMAFW